MSKVNVTSTESRRLFQLLAEVKSFWNSANSGQENECLALLDLLEKTRQKWLESFNGNEQRKRVIQALEEENRALCNNSKLLNEQLKDTRAQVAELISRNISAEHELAELKGKFDLAKQLLKSEGVRLNEQQAETLASNKKPNSTAHLGVRAHGTSFTLVGDELDYSDDQEQPQAGVVLRSGRSYKSTGGGNKRPRAVIAEAPIAEMDESDSESPGQKKRSKEADDDIGAYNSSQLNLRGRQQTPAAVSRLRNRRSFSEPNLDDAVSSARKYNAISPMQSAVSTYDVRTPQSANRGTGAIGVVKTWTNGSSIDQRRHSFLQKWSVVMREHCDVCGERFGFAQNAFKCADCRMLSHDKCQDKSPLPCVPYAATPKAPATLTPRGTQQASGRKTNAIRRPHLREFCPSDPPMIPHILIHCILALEKQHLNYMGIYRIPGSESAVVELLTAFKAKRAPPRLDKTDAETITGCIKRFLSELHQPLIPSASWREFVRAAAAAKDDGGASLHSAIADLPMPHRDTLAYLCAHLQRVAERSTVNKMPRENLARCLAPTVVGYSTDSPTFQQATQETPQMAAVMLALLNLPIEYWTRYYTYQQTNPPLINTPKTPNARACGDEKSPDLRFESSLLGPPFKTGNQPPQSPPKSAKRNGSYFPQPWR